MSERAKTHQPPPSTGRQSWANRLDAAAFFIVLLIVAMRPLLSETFHSNLHSIARAAEAVGEPTPATTAWLDFGIWAAAIATAVSSFLQKRRWRLTGAEFGGAILVIAAVISTAAASNKRLALNASSDWLTALVVVAVVANLCRDRMRIGLLLAALAASGMAAVAKSGMQVGLEYPETRAHYEQNKETFWGAQNVSLDDSSVTLYERRLEAGEASGFFPVSNTNAAWLGLAGFSALALGGLVWRRRRAWMVTLVPAVLAFAAIFLTGSKGAMLAMAAGVVIWLVLVRCHLHLQDRWRLTLLAAWLVLVGLVSAGITYGVARGGLPGDSLQFRWNYWTATQDILAEHLTTGVGALNFDHAYLAVKPIEYPEEIRDPHNFILSVLAQWGLLGGVGLLAVFVGGSIVVARTWGTREPTEAPPPVYDPEAKYVSLQWVVAVAIGFVLLRVWLLRGWLAESDGAAYVFFDIGLYGMIWILLFGCLCWVVRGGWVGDIDICQVGCLAGVLGFVLHNLIDFAMFNPGTLMPFAVLAGILVTDKPRRAPQQVIPTRPGVPLAVFIIGAAVFVGLVLVPVTRANRLLQRARYASTSLAEQRALYESATQADPFDPTPPAELAMVRAHPGGDLASALHWLKVAVDRDPQQIGLYRTRAGLLEMSFRQSGAVTDLIGAIGAARQVVALYPESPDDHLFLADLLARNAAAAGQGAIEEAIFHMRRALMLDAARSEREIRRWSESRRRTIKERLNQLMDMAAERSVSRDDLSAIENLFAVGVFGRLESDRARLGLSR